jgi:hypothetical protein
MRPPLSYHLTTAAALLAILLCGYGVGFLVGERVTQKRLGPPDSGPGHAESWETATLERLTRELNLSPKQREQVAHEIHLASGIIEHARLEASHIYSNELLDLHERLLPHLDASQRGQIEESSRRLKKMLDEK